MILQVLESRSLFAQVGNSTDVDAVKNYLAAESQEDLIEEIFYPLPEATLQHAHVSNAFSLLRYTLPTLFQWHMGYPLPDSKAAFADIVIQGAEGGARYWEFISQLNRADAPYIESPTQIAHFHKNEELDEAWWQQVLTGTWLGIWMLEMGLVLAGTNHQNLVKQGIGHAIQLITAGFIYQNIDNALENINEQRERSITATHTAKLLNKPDLEPVAHFIANAQGPSEGLYILACNFVQMLGILPSVFSAGYWLYQKEAYPVPDWMGPATKTFIAIGNSGYLLNGLWNGLAWAFESTQALLARYTAAYNLATDKANEANSTLLEKDPEYVLNYILKLLDSDFESHKNGTMIFLQSLGVSIPAIEALRKADPSDDIARRYLGKKLGI